jgi:hypothetical protein
MRRTRRRRPQAVRRNLRAAARTRRRVLTIGLLALCGAFLLLVQPVNATNAPAGRATEVPRGAPLFAPVGPRVLALYDSAAARYKLSAPLLRALHQVESSSAGDGCLLNRQGSGATGPFQFKPATFRAYGIDADGNGKADICGLTDSLFSAARYLQVLGADSNPTSPNTSLALRRYGTDPALVVRLAATLSKTGASAPIR